ncbi:hypothetical protein DFH09DRAFT_1472995 [Mycena vulgaris]|nr:hypothetical protein DFH09DRAFT_1472995 [Mycena vulgaris]
MASSSTHSNATPGSSGSRGDDTRNPRAGDKRRERSEPLDDPTGGKKSRRAKPQAAVKAPQYHIKKNQIPEEQKGTKDCIYIHGYILYCVVSSRVPPPALTADQLNVFEECYAPGFLSILETNLRKTSTSTVGAVLMAKELRKKAEDAVKHGSTIAKHILRIHETFIIEIYSGVLCAGLTAWRPNFSSPPDTPYNKAHSLVLVETFKSVASSFTYRELAPMSSGINNHALITDLYHSYVFHYMKHKARIEGKETGKLEKIQDDSNISRRCVRLTDKRVDFGTLDKLPARVISLFSDPRCNSDDESGSDADHQHIFLVNKKDILNLIGLPEAKKCSNLAERTRVRRPNTTESGISFQLPPSDPIDSLDPETYNDLAAQTRFNYFQNGVALPLVEHHNKTDWMTMDKPTFMEKYGNNVLKLYNIPTEEERAEAGNMGWDGMKRIPT